MFWLYFALSAGSDSRERRKERKKRDASITLLKLISSSDDVIDRVRMVQNGSNRFRVPKSMQARGIKK